MERNANLGYIAVTPQVDKSTVAQPTIFLYVYGCDIRTNPNFQKQNPIAGNKFKNRSTLRGQRGHTGNITFEGEPVAASHVANMFMTKGSESGTGPYTNSYTGNKITDPKYYTADVSFVTHVVRFIGLACSNIAVEWEDNELRLNASVSCLKVWDGREVASKSSQILTLSKKYDRLPNVGLVVGDVLQYWDASAASYTDLTVSALNANGTDVTVTGTIPVVAAGDYVTLKPATSPSFSNGPTFTFADTEYRFGATAAAALTATHTPLEKDTSLSLSHEFEDSEGSKRSGSYDPASLPRMQTDYSFKPKKYFDTPTDLQKYSAMEKTACVVRHFAYDATNTYELRITLNNMTPDNPAPNLEPETILYSEIEMSGNYDSSDAAGVGITVISPNTLG